MSSTPEDASTAVVQSIPRKGIQRYTTTSGIPVTVFHYSAVRSKDPDTEEGAIWKAAELEGYPGGERGAKWQQEMEINFGIRDSARVWPDFMDMMPRITIQDFDIRSHPNWPIYVGYDYGYAKDSASAWTVLAFASENEVFQIDEMYLKGMSILEQVQILRQKPYYDRINGYYADPAIWARTQQNGALVTSLAQLFADEFNIHMNKGQNFNGSDSAFIHMLSSVLWAEPLVRFRIFQSCVHTLKELRLLSWRERKASDNVNAEYETIANKNVHAFDALKYALLELWQGAVPSSPETEIGSVEWHIQQMERSRRMVEYVV